MKRRNAGGLAVTELMRAMESLAPRGAAAEWDNVGLLVGDPYWPLRKALLTIDLTAAVLEEAKRSRIDAIVSYHPPIFKPTKSMRVSQRSQEGIAAEALAHRIAVYSPHTALDAAVGGTNDALAALCGLAKVQPFAWRDDPPTTGKCKLVVFVPGAAVERVAEALFEAGCGQIGGYEKCSFRSGGQGTFFGTEFTSPRVGQRGRLERVDEVRLEVVCTGDALPSVVRKLRAAHPYETPAFDVYRLRPLPWDGVGQGREGEFERPVDVFALARTLRRKTRAAQVSVIGNRGQTVRRAMICVGAAGSLPFKHGCHDGDVVITGEIRHHDALEYVRCGAAAIALGHWASERPVLKPLAARLRKELPGVEFVISKVDRDPFDPI